MIRIPAAIRNDLGRFLSLAKTQKTSFSDSPFATIPFMNLGLISFFPVLAILSALAMLAGYVGFRQKIGPFAKDQAAIDFPITSFSPTPFTTTKSGPVLLPSHDEEGSKSMTADTIDELIGESASGGLITVEEVEKPTIFISTKRIEMPVFNVRQNKDEKPNVENPNAPPFLFQSENGTTQQQMQFAGGSPNQTITIGGSTKSAGTLFPLKPKPEKKK
jgi:hypothetical protein